MYNNVSCIILCGGYSSRMKTKHKALLEIENGFTMLEKVVNTFKKAGVEDIIVVLGYEEEKIRLAHTNLNCTFVYNKDFDKGMFSSVCAGIASLQKSVEASFILPVDAALIKSSTLTFLLEQRKKNKEEGKNISLLIPTFLEESGHPPLFEKKHFSLILQYAQYENTKGFKGLKGYFASLLNSEKARSYFLKSQALPSNFENTSEVEFIPLCDKGIISDLDNIEEYTKAQEFIVQTKYRQYPDITEAFYLLLQAELPVRTKKHILKVAFGALRLAIKIQHALNIDFSLMNSVCGGLLHDICRTQKKHAQAGAEFLKVFGWIIMPEIVASHTNLPLALIKKLNIETDEDLKSIDVSHLLDNNDYIYPCICVYLADKYYNSDMHVSLDQRHEIIRERCVDNEIALKMISKRQRIAQDIEKYFNEVTKARAYKIVEQKTDNIIELQLLSLIKNFNEYFIED